MYVETERSRNGYRAYSERKDDDRFRRKNSRFSSDNHHHYSSRISFKSRHHHTEDYPLNRTGNGQSSYNTSRFDRQINNHDIYPSLLNNQSILEGGPPPTDSYYNSSQSSRDRGLTGHYMDTERNRYPASSSSSTYRRESSPPPSSSYRNDVYIREEYRSPTPLSVRSSAVPYDEIYRTSDYQNRSERYELPQNRNCSITSQPSSIYRSDPYPTSSYVPRDQYTPSLAPMREVDYRTRDYGMPTAMDYHPTVSNKSSDRYHSSSSYRDRPILKRSRSNFHENRSKRPMRR